MNGTGSISEDARAALRKPESYREAATGARECDVVMKGGITSGVVYPLAVCELARRFRLRNVGGTSAGAIAAALSAAAEHGRGGAAAAPSGFARLAGLPEWIGGDGRLLALFRPDRRTRSLFRIAMAAIRRRRGVLCKLRLALAVVWATSRAALASRELWLPLLGTLPGALVLAALAPWEPAPAGPIGPVGWLGIAAALLIVAGGWTAGAAVAVARVAARRLPRNLYGLVSGSGPVGGEVPRLTDWLADEIDRTAGRPAGATDPPLTFGELWRGPEGEGSAADPAVRLEMLTTDLTTGGPLRLPYELGRGYFFHPDEMRRLFPERVVRSLESSPPSEEEMTPSERKKWHEEVGLFAERGLRPMPDPENLPVVVATRMSLSFPILLSALPLHALDRSLAAPRPEPVWLSDGGITSNFPVHFFDTPLPVRPTFGFNLRPFHAEHPKRPDECDNVFVPEDNRSGILAWWTRWHDRSGFGRLGGFFGAILNALQNWVDNAQLPVPGYRDRVAHVSHDESEGGMNLDMPPEVLAALSERGRCGGERLADWYTTPPADGRKTSWENHRWVRLRSSLGLLEELLDELERDWTAGEYRRLLEGYRNAPSYRMTGKQQTLAVERMDALIAGARAWRDALAADANRSLRRKAPNPRPAFRVVPAPGGPEEIDETEV